jgi:hypothetical protein
MKTYRKVEVQFHHYLPWHRKEISGHLHARPIYSRGLPDNPWIWGWVGPRAILNVMEKRKASWFCWESNLAVQSVARLYTEWVVSAPHILPQQNSTSNHTIDTIPWNKKPLTPSWRSTHASAQAQIPWEGKTLCDVLPQCPPPPVFLQSCFSPGTVLHFNYAWTLVAFSISVSVVTFTHKNIFARNY